MFTFIGARWGWALLAAVTCLFPCSCKHNTGSGPEADAVDGQVGGDSEQGDTDGSSTSDPSNGEVPPETSGQDSTGQPDGGSLSGPITADHQAVAAFAGIPESTFNRIRLDLRIFYGHTSHGSQIVTGMQMLATDDSTLYELPELHEDGTDLGYAGDLGWVDTTRAFLNDDDDAGINVVVWSWCGGVSDNTEEGIDAYLSAMDQLERDYPRVTFVYMTGHRDDNGEDGTLMVRNAQIRDWCLSHGKLLFDFADIESWDPGGSYHPNTTDACEWCADWCTAHSTDCPSCEDCAHSHCFNCYLKGKAFWWLLARMTGWEG